MKFETREIYIYNNLWKRLYGNIVCVGTIAVSVLLKLFICGDFFKCHSIDAIYSREWAELSIYKPKQHTNHDPRGPATCNHNNVVNARN